MSLVHRQRSIRCARFALPLAPVFLFLLTACATTPHEPASGASPGAVELSDETPLVGSGARLWVRGMSCPKCVSNVDIQLKRLPGVSSVAINMNAGTVGMRFAGEGRPTRGQIAKAVDDAALTLDRIEVVP